MWSQSVNVRLYVYNELWKSLFQIMFLKKIVNFIALNVKHKLIRDHYYISIIVI